MLFTKESNLLYEAMNEGRRLVPAVKTVNGIEDESHTLRANPKGVSDCFAGFHETHHTSPVQVTLTLRHYRTGTCKGEWKTLQLKIHLLLPLNTCLRSTEEHSWKSRPETGQKAKSRGSGVVPLTCRSIIPGVVRPAMDRKGETRSVHWDVKVVRLIRVQGSMRALHTSNNISTFHIFLSISPLS